MDSLKKINAPDANVVFMGTPELAADMLEELIERGYHIVGVVTQPDKKVGREQTLAQSAVKVLAAAHHVPVLTPSTLDEGFIQELKRLEPRVILVVAYGKILPKAVLEIPTLGALNVHASLLPRYRGASPIQNALLSGETETGVTLMLMDEGVDTGPIIAQNKFAIPPAATAEDLRRLVATAGRALLAKTLPLWLAKKIKPQAQDETQVTLCQLIEREDGRVLWSESAESIYNRYRALYPWPGLYTFLKKNEALLRLKLLMITCQKQSPQIKYPLGQIFEVGEKVGVQTGSGVIFLETVQLEGKSPMPIHEFLPGFPGLVGGFFH